MKVNVDRFFLKTNEVEKIPESYYDKISPVIDAVKAFARSSNQCLYVVDYARKGFLYVSPNLQQMCGMCAEEMMELGYGFQVKYAPYEDQKMLVELNKSGFDFFENIPVNQRDGYSISYDFRLQNGEREQMIHHTLTHLVTTKKGRVWIALCTMSPSSAQKPGNIIMRKEGKRIVHEYDLEVHEWKDRKLPKLNPTEKIILTRLMQGYTMEEISKNEGIPLNTLKASKRLLFVKLNVNNISQAIAYCMNYKLL